KLGTQRLVIHGTAIMGSVTVSNCRASDFRKPATPRLLSHCLDSHRSPPDRHFEAGTRIVAGSDRRCRTDDTPLRVHVSERLVCLSCGSNAQCLTAALALDVIGRFSSGWCGVVHSW